MSILARILRHFQLHGSSIYTGAPTLGGSLRPHRRKGKGSWARSRYMELMEPRVLMTTVFGGETFVFTDARGQTTTARLNGGVVAELVAAIQDADGSLKFGDIAGRISAGPRAGTIIGNGSLPVSGATSPRGGEFTSQSIPAGLNVLRGPSPTGQIGNQVNIQGIASNAAGNTFAFNTYDVLPNGATIVDADGKTIWTLQLLNLNNTSGAATVLGNLSSLVPAAATETNIGGAAFNPFTGQLDFELHYKLENTGAPTTFFDHIFQIDVNNPGAGATDLGAINNTINGKDGVLDFTAMTFVVNSATDATLWFAQRPNKDAVVPPAPAAPPQPTLNQIAVASDGTFNTTVITNSTPVYEGYGTGQTPLSSLTGLVSLPGSGGNFLFGTVAGASGNGVSHIVRIDLSQTRTLNIGNENTVDAFVGTTFGNTVNLFESTAPANTRPAPTAPFDGENLQGLTYNPTIVNPFTGKLGALFSVDKSTYDMVFVNAEFRVTTGDIFSVYTNQADINASITVQGSSLYSGGLGAAFGSTALPGNTGRAYLGFLGDLPSGNTFTSGHPFLSGQLDGSLGILPGVYSTDLSIAAPANLLNSGLIVGRSLEQRLNPNADLLAQLLGLGFSNVTNMAISNNGTTVVANAHVFGNTGASDQLGFVNTATGAVSSVLSVHLANSTILRDIQALAYGDANLTGVQQLYAVYDLNDGHGPTLGTINTTTGLFTPIGTGLGAGVNARVAAIAFSPGSTAADPLHQGLYLIADANAQDGDSIQKLYQVNPATGAVLNAGGIGSILDGSGNLLKVVSAAFDGQGRLLLDDQRTGRLMDVNVSTAVAGNVFTTNPGSINPTVGAVAFDPTTLRFFAADNETGTTQISNGTSSSTSILMVIKNFAQQNADSVTLGKFLFDGVVTGRVYISGSIDTFYSGLLLTGDASNGGSWLLPNGVSETAANEPLLVDNFHAEGDIRNLLSLTSMGTSVTTTPINTAGQITFPDFITGLQISARGKIGNVQANAVFEGAVHAGNQNNIPNIVDGATASGNTSYQSEIQYWATTGTNSSLTFGNGLIVDTQTVRPFDNRTFDGAQFLGTIRNAVDGQPDVIHLKGELMGNTPPTNTTYENNTVDYFGVSLLAGQTVTVNVVGDPLNGAVNYAIYDPDGRQIATDYNHLNTLQTQGRPIQFTADRPGVYRIAVTAPGNTTFAQSGNPGVFDYDLTVTGAGDTAVGAVTAGTSIILPGGGAQSTTGLIPGILADTGDIGAIVAGKLAIDRSSAILVSAYQGFAAFNAQTDNGGYSLLGTTPAQGDVTTLNGNLRVIQGGSIGFNNIVTAQPNIGGSPDLSINGKVGLVQSTGGGIVFATFGNAAAGDIQVIDSSAEIAGVYRTNKAIGVIRAAQMQMGTVDTEFHANVDGIGSDGVIDLIDVAGNVGTLNLGGPSIVTGDGGNVRFMHIGGVMWQDSLFSTGQVGTRGEVVHQPGDVTFTDDSGAFVTLSPGSVAAGTTSGSTTLGTLTTRVYSIRGAGGVAIVDVTSSTGLSVKVEAGANDRPAEIGQINTGGAGLPLTIVGTTPANPTGTATGQNNVIITSDGGRVDVFSITNGGSGTINNISNTTGGDIENITAGAIGSIVSTGNLGSMISTTGATIIPIAVFNNTYPFVDQHFGISAANIGLISSTKSIGNVLASGAIGTITPNSDGINDPAVFEGITGPIVANGSVAGTTPIPGSTRVSAVSITQVNIGEGILPSGSGSMSNAGIYAVGQIVKVAGTSADIRGDIMSNDSIVNITLTDGSIIDADIYVTSSWTDGIEYQGTTITLPSFTTDIDHPINNISNVTINGNGGIIGTQFYGGSIGTITVGAAGYGIFNTNVGGVGVGSLTNITAGGYGIRNMFISGYARIGTLSATGSGAPSNISAFSPSVRQSEHVLIDPFFNTQVNALTDLNIALNGDLVTGVDPSGLTTGVMELVRAAGQDRISNILAYDVISSTFNFANAAGNIAVRHDVNGLNLITGSLTSFTVGHDLLLADFAVAGKIGNIAIKGNYVAGILRAKGASGDISKFSVGGNDSGTLTAESSIGTVTIGTPGSAGNPSTGDLTGSILITGNRLTKPVITLLKVFGSVAGGTLKINGSAGTIDIAHDLTGLAQDLVINGNLTNLSIGTDTSAAANGSILGSSLTVNGNLTKAVITGAMAGALIVKGNLTGLSVVSDAATAGTSIMSGNLSVSGVIAGLTVTGGDVSGSIVAGLGITGITITKGSLLAGGAIASSLGNVAKLTITNGSLDGSVAAPNGAITTVTLTGTSASMGSASSISAKSLGTLTVPGAVNGTIDVVNAITTLKLGSVGTSASFTANILGHLTTTGAMLGDLTVGFAPANIVLTIGGNFGGTTSLGGPLSATIGGNMLAGSQIASTSNVISLAVKGSLDGQLLVDRYITTLSAASMNGAVVTSGLGVGTVKVTGSVVNSLLDVGLARGNDGIFGTADIGGEPRMADANSVTVGSMLNSVFAVGGNVTTFKSTGNMSSSSFSAGLVLGGSNIDAILADATPLANAGELDAARQGTTLFHGNINSASVGAGTANTMINSSITAGVSPATDGSFGSSVNLSLTGGASKIGTFKAKADGTSHVLANSLGAAGVTLVKYTVDAGIDSILAADPIPLTPPTAIATAGHPATVGGITVTVTGAGASVSIYDDLATTDRLDTLLINNTGTAAVSVSVVTATPGTYDLGRVIATDGTVVSSFTFNGDILGDVNGGPALWIDSDMTTFTVRNLPNDSSWNGQIGGNVGKLTLNQLGPGRLRIGGKVATLAIASSVGNPLLQELGSVTPAATITQMAFNPNTNGAFATNGTSLLGVDVTTGSVLTNVPIVTPLGTHITLNGMAFNSAGQLFGVATLNNQIPITSVGSISDGDQLRGLAVNSQGQIFAIDGTSGHDALVQIDPVTGARTVLGELRDRKFDAYTNNVLALAFDQNDTLLALIADFDGDGGVSTSANGVSLARISTTPTSGFIRVSNPTTTNLSQDPVLLTGAVLGNFTGMTVDSGGNIYAVRHVGSSDELDKITVAGTGNSATAALAVLGNIKLDSGATDTSLVGIGTDADGNIIGLNAVGATRELIGINTTTPATSVRLTAPGLLSTPLSGFAIGPNGSGTFQAFGYTTDSTTGGTFFSSPGDAPTLGIIATTGPNAGTFTQLLPLAADADGSPLSGTVEGLAVDASGNLFVVTDNGELAEYSAADGSLIGGAPLGTIVDNVNGAGLEITRIAFDSAGNLVGLNAQQNRLVLIDPNTSDGSVVLASGLTEAGSADAGDLSSLVFSSVTNTFLSYSNTSGNFVSILGTSPSTLGGIVARAFGAVTLPANFGGHLVATGNGIGNSIDSIKFTGAGTFTGNINSDGSIGAITGTVTSFDGAIVSHGDIASVALTGDVGANGVFSADGLFKTFALTKGSFGGTYVAGRATSFVTNGTTGTLAGSLIVVNNDIATFTLGGQAAGTASLGSVKTLKVGGLLTSTGFVFLGDDSGALTVTGGTDLGSLFLANGAVTSLTVGGTLAGVVATRHTLKSATLNILDEGVLDVGGDLTSLTVKGAVTDSLISAGTWIGLDGTYNTADDVIYGGSITTAKISGAFTDSYIIAGVLPREGTDSFANNIPTDTRSFTGNTLAGAIGDIDSGEAGGIAPSIIKSLNFAKPVISSDIGNGILSLAITADGFGTVVSPGALTKLVLSDPIGLPTVVADAATLQNGIRVSPSEIRIIFSEPLDTATLNNQSIVVDDGNGIVFDNLTLAYFTQTAPDGSTQGVLRILSPDNFNSLSSVNVTLAGGPDSPSITDRTGLRSALLDFDQNGIKEGDPFGTPINSQTFNIQGAPVNDNFAAATLIPSIPATVTGGTIRATREVNEPLILGNAGGASIWFMWVAPSTGSAAVDTFGSDFDTLLGIYTGAGLPTLTLVGENDDFLGPQSQVSFAATSGVTYYIAVDGFNGATGNVMLNIS